MAQITLNSSGVASNGALVLQSNGTTTAVTISTAQVATLEKDAVVNGLTVGRGAGAVSTNTAVGASALQANTTASNNTAVGYQAGYTANGTCPDNTVIGHQAGYAMTNSGGYNTFVGVSAGVAVTTGQENQFFGRFSGSVMTTGSKNTIIGKYTGNQGGLDIRTASNNIVLSDGDGNPRGVYVPTQGIGWNFGGNAVTNNYGGSGNTTINTVPYSQGSGGGLAVVRGYDGSTGNPYVRLYVVAIQVAGGSSASTSALVSSAGSAGATFTFGFTGGYVTVTGASTNGGAWSVSYFGL